MLSQTIYENGDYLRQNPSWHLEYSDWKAQRIMQAISRNSLVPKTICEVGCGAGGILQSLQTCMDRDVEFWGFDVSPQAMELCLPKANDRLHFKCQDIKMRSDIFFDIVMAIDVIEHLEDYFGFLKEMKSLGVYKIFHIPLDISVQTVLRSTPITHLRKSVGHIHYFTKETALEALKDAGYELLDFFYTAQHVDLPGKTIKSHLAAIPRRLFYSINQDLAVRFVGGYSLMVVAR
jgi:hypothetical protein